MRYLRSLRPLLVVLFVTVFSSYASAQGALVAFEGARIITGDGSAPIENGVLVMDGQRISAVGRRGEVSIPAGAERVDLTGKTVMPALIDSHKHLSNDRDTLIRQLKELAYFGVGTVMNLGQDTTDVPFQLRGDPVPGAAKLYTAGRGITMPEPGRNTAPYWIISVEEGRDAVREQAELNVDIIKIWVDDRDGSVQKMPPDIYTAIIEEAHRHDIPVTAHIYALEDAKALLKVGLDAFAHGIRDMDLDDEAVALFKANPDVYLVPNLPGSGRAADMSWLKGAVPDADFQKIQAAAKGDPKAQEFFGIQSRNLNRLNREGVKIAFGTDGSVTWEAHTEIENMVLSGMTPSEAIVAATKTSAEMMRIGDKVGTLSPGKSADLLVLDANPLDDITNTRKINRVYLRGMQVAR